jgi:hypothetical protein
VHWQLLGWRDLTAKQQHWTANVTERSSGNCSANAARSAAAVQQCIQSIHYFWLCGCEVIDRTDCSVAAAAGILQQLASCLSADCARVNAAAAASSSSNDSIKKT